jgi:hypothetical protein
LTEKAKERVTERGSPSGMATTITVIPIMKYPSIFSKSSLVFHYGLTVILKMAKRMKRTAMMIMAEAKANFPILSAKASSFC